MIRQALRGCDAVISVCGALRDRMVELGAPAKKISVIPNGVDLELFPLVERAEARAALGLPADAQIVLSVGALKELKGHHVTIEALQGVLPSSPRARLHILGEGPERPALETRIRQRGLGDRVFLVGERPNRELYLWYNAADCFCLASSREGWANVLMESLACGTPVVATNVWGAPEIVTTPEVGLLCAREPGDLAAKLQAALARTWDRAAIRAHVAGRTWETVGREVAGVFEGVLVRRASRA
jgi:glycosyltransferase involved in cell wall biosynthesis